MTPVNPVPTPALHCVPVSRGLLLPCPRCGEAEATIHLYLSDMETLYCADCEEEFSVADVQTFIAKWAPVLAWINQAPTATE